MDAAVASVRRTTGGGGAAFAAPGEAAVGVCVRLAIAAMGTRFELVLPAGGDAGAFDERHLRAAGELALEEIRLAHERLSAFEPASLVSAINRMAGAGPVVVDAQTFDLLKQAADVHRASEGAFDITLGPLMRAWGFRGAAPNPAAAKQAREVCGMGLVALDPATRRVGFIRAGAQLDLGAIAKGHALDLAGAALREHGVRCALLHGGTSAVLALGAPPGTAGWRVALADRGRRLGPVVRLRDQALSVSSPSGRVAETTGEALGHVLDPRTGAPAAGAQFAAVIAMAGSADCGACALADAWATALLVCGGRPAGMPGELTSLMLRACADGWTLEGPAASAVASDAGGEEGGRRGACCTRETLA